MCMRPTKVHQTEKWLCTGSKPVTHTRWDTEQKQPFGKYLDFMGKVFIC